MSIHSQGASPIGENGGQQTITEESRWEIIFEVWKLQVWGMPTKQYLFWGGRERRNVKILSIHPKSLGSEAGSASSVLFLIDLHLAYS